jgi:hypothetical protein
LGVTSAPIVAVSPDLAGRVLDLAREREVERVQEGEGALTHDDDQLRWTMWAPA